MANPIRRLVQLILDRNAAGKMQADAKQALGGIEGALQRLRSVAARVGGAIVGFLSLRSLARFGQEAVQEAANAEKSWSSLKSTIEATGTAFEDVEGQVRSVRDAFTDATIHGSGAFDSALQRLVALTGDVSASLHNMGLVANTAARFFDGDLARAADAVGKIMNGNTRELRQFGIQTDNALEGLQRLARAGFGAATAEADTFAGRVAQLANAWNDFKQALGEVVVGSGETTTALGLLRGVVLALTASVKENEELLRAGFVGALELVIEVGDGVYRGIKGLAELLAGGFTAALTATLTPLAGWALILAKLTEWAGKLAAAVGLEGLAGSLNAFSESAGRFVTNWAQALRGAGEDLNAAVKTFSERSQTAEDLLAGLNNPFRLRRRPPPEKPPVLGKGAVGEDEKKLADAFKEFERAMRAADVQGSVLGDRFDKLGAQAGALKAIITALATLDPENAKLAGFATQLRAVEDEIAGLAELGERAKTQLKAITEDFEAPTITLNLGDLPNSIDLLEAEIFALEDALADLQPGTDQWEVFADQLDVARDKMALLHQEAAIGAEVLAGIGGALGAALTGGLRPFAQAKAKENLIQAAEQTAQGIAAALSIFGAANAGVHFGLAAKYTAIAAAWTGLAGGSLGGAGAGGGGGAAGARAAGNQAAQRAEAPPTEVTIVLAGHLSALDPKVQKVVYGAMQQARERYGDQANVKLQLRDA